MINTSRAASLPNHTTKACPALIPPRTAARSRGPAAATGSSAQSQSPCRCTMERGKQGSKRLRCAHKAQLRLCTRPSRLGTRARPAYAISCCHNVPISMPGREARVVDTFMQSATCRPPHREARVVHTFMQSATRRPPRRPRQRAWLRPGKPHRQKRDTTRSTSTSSSNVSATEGRAGRRTMRG